MVESYLHTFDRVGDLGVLCDGGLFVVDFDEEATYHEWHAQFGAAFDDTVLAKTRKGFHVWFKRTPLCDALGLRDGPVGTFPGPDGKLLKKPMDIKTITASASQVPDPDNPGQTKTYYTPGFCAVYPSPNKTWIRSPFEHVIRDVPDDLARRLLAERGGKPVPLTGEGKRRREFTVVEELTATKTKAFWRACELDVPCLVAMGFRRDLFLTLYEYEATKTRTEGGYVGGTVLEFQMKKGFPCPLCGKSEGHSNSFWVAHLPDGSRKIKNMSPTCFPHYVKDGRKYPGPFYLVQLCCIWSSLADFPEQAGTRAASWFRGAPKAAWAGCGPCMRRADPHPSLSWNGSALPTAAATRSQAHATVSFLRSARSSSPAKPVP